MIKASPLTVTQWELTKHPRILFSMLFLVLGDEDRLLHAQLLHSSLKCALWSLLCGHTSMTLGIQSPRIPGTLCRDVRCRPRAEVCSTGGVDHLRNLIPDSSAIPYGVQCLLLLDKY